MKASLIFTTLFACAALGTVNAEVYFKEDFSAAELGSKWVVSGARDDYGKFEVTPGKFYADEKKSRGLQTSEDARFYSISAPFDKNFNTKGKDLVAQFSVKHEQDIDCGGGYVKLMPPSFDPKNFTGDSPYEIMFGPDICGPTKRVHVIFSYKGDNKLIKKTIACPADQFSHLYTLVVKPDQSYKVLIDQKEEASGSLLDDWEFLASKTIKDPDAKKPEDWVEEAMIPDPEDKKPEDADDVPEYIPDPDATKPEDWDDEADGDWESPKIENPEFKGKWQQKMIKNPDYKGPWVQPEMPNPDYIPDEHIYERDLGFVGFDLWQVKSGTIFDDILITDSEAEAEEAAKKNFEAYREKEREAKTTADEEEAKKAEETQKKADEKKEEEEIKEKVKGVVAAEELAAIEENEPLDELESSLGGDAALDAVERQAKAQPLPSGAGDKIKQAIKDEL